MPKRIIISERQMGIIINHINDNNNFLMNEGFKEVALGLLMLAGVNLSGQNKEVAEKSIKDNNILTQIDDIVNDINKLDNVVEKIDKTMPNTGDLIKNNLYQIKTKINADINNTHL